MLETRGGKWKQKRERGEGGEGGWEKEGVGRKTRGGADKRGALEMSEARVEPILTR